MGRVRLPAIRDLRHWPTPGRIFFLACLCHALWALHIAWDHPLLDDHAFRQTQTALSAYYMVGNPPKLAYETPVLGPPWSIPFEFPLYQWIVAGLVTLLRTPLDQTGRFVSVVFFLLTLWPANVLLRRLNVDAEGRFVILGLFLLSPFYLFWSRAFMIESTALFLSVCYLAAAWSCLESPRPGRIAAALGFGCLAGPVKATTLAAFLIAVALLAAHAGWVRRRTASRGVATAAWIAMCMVLLAAPVAVTALWVRFADRQKELNPLGRGLTSTALWTWNFGTLAQRQDPETWTMQYRRAARAVDYPVILFGICGTLLTRRRWRAAVVCGILYLSAPLIFTNLHYRHTYYAYANDLFLVAAIGLGLVGVLEAPRPLRTWGLVALPLIFVLGCWRHQGWYAATLETSETPYFRIARAIEQATRKEDVVLSLGRDWTSELAYYSRRRTLMKVGSAAECVRALPDLEAQLEGHRVGAVVLHKSWLGSITPEQTRSLLAILGPDPREVYAEEGTEVYAARQPGSS